MKYDLSMVKIDTEGRPPPNSKVWAEIAGTYEEIVNSRQSSLHVLNPATSDFETVFLANGGTLFCLLNPEHEIVSFGFLKRMAYWPIWNYSWEAFVYTKPSHRGKGYGRLLFEKILTAAKDLKLKNLLAVVETTSARLDGQGFPIKMGFVQIGALNEIVERDEESSDLLFYQFRLGIN